jgi:N-ethylmaleimide reductase
MFMAPMTRNRAADDGVPTQLQADFYSQRSASGLMITEGTYPSAIGQAYPNQPGLHTEAHQAGWARVVDAVHAAGGRIVLQLLHSGRVSHPRILGGELPVAPSAIAPIGSVHTATGRTPFVVPRELRADELPNVIDEFVEAATRARVAGADAVEIHAANGYLLSQFLGYNSNRRGDAYGGSAPNRTRFPGEVVRAVAEAIGPDRVGLRLSPGNTENDIHDSDFEAYLVLAERARELGLAYLHVRATPDQPILWQLRHIWPDRLVLNQGFDVATTREQAGQVLICGVADAVTIGRAYLANPDLVQRWTDGAELNSPRTEFLYVGGPLGYTDYPTLPN